MSLPTRTAQVGDVFGCPPARAVPPLESEGLQHLLEKVRAWQPFDRGALLDDVAEVLDDLIPDEDDVEELGQRLCGHLMQLAHVAVAANAEEHDERIAPLVERSRVLRSEDMPGDHWQAVGHLRRMGWVVNELLERLVETKCLKAAP
jgi:hypothetical protein